MKKLLNKRGSVLFLVVVVMALLLVAASATYYVIRNQHASANTHYSSEQSYQTAYSVSKTLEKYFTEEHAKIAKNRNAYEGSLLQKMMNLPTGGYLNASNDLRDYGLGGFDIKIRKTEKSTKNEGIFEITTKADTNGETTVLTQVWKIKLTAAETEYFTRFLTSTGQESLDDCYLTAMRIFGAVYFENEYTRLSNPVKINENFYATGTYEDDGVNFGYTGDGSNQKMDIDIFVGENLILNSTGGGAMNVNRVFVGGDLDTSQKDINANAVYVCGNMNYTRNASVPDVCFFVQGNATVTHTMSGDIVYIGGDLHISGNGQANSTYIVFGTVYDEGASGDPLLIYSPNEKKGSGGANVYNDFSAFYTKFKSLYPDKEVYSTIEAAMQAVSEATQDDDSTTNDVFTSWENVVNYIASNTSQGTYKIWDAESFFEQKTEKDEETNIETTVTGQFYDAPTIDVNSAVMGTYVGGQDENGNWFGATNPPFVNLTSTGVDIANGIERAKSWVEKDGNYFRITIGESCRLLPCGSNIGAGSCIMVDASEEDIYIYLQQDGGAVNPWSGQMERDADTFTFFDNVSCNVYITGQNAVIFVLPDGTNFKSGSQQFVGHYDIAKKLSGDPSFNGLGYVNIPQAITDADKFEEKLGNDKVLTTVTKTMLDEDGNPMKDDNGNEITYTESYLDPSKFGVGSTVHNNVFLVARGSDNSWDFNNPFTLSGYVYAPMTDMLVGRGGGGCLQFYGGLIVGSYTYTNESGYLGFIQPYDPYTTEESRKGANIVSWLINQAGGATIGGDSTDGAKNVDIIPMGYK